MVVTHAATGRPFTTKYAHSVFGRERTTLEQAFPGDVIGLVNAGTLRAGDTLYSDDAVAFPPIPSFAPEHFAVVRAKDVSRYKQFARGISQLEQEGVVQVLRSDFRGSQSPVLAAVGPMQFEVVEHRMAGEFSSPVVLDRLDYSIARTCREQDVVALAAERGVEVMTRGDGAILALFTDIWRVRSVERQLPDVPLEPLVAAAD